MALNNVNINRYDQEKCSLYKIDNEVKYYGFGIFANKRHEVGGVDNIGYLDCNDLNAV